MKTAPIRFHRWMLAFIGLMANPYITNSPSDPHRIYRLRKTQ